MVIGLAVAEPPRPFFPGYDAPPPPAPSKQQLLPQRNYGAPMKQFAASAPQQEYGPPAEEYGPPAQQYGPPVPEKIITKNVYVHVPPEEPVEFKPSKQIEIPTPKKHYKIIFIKAPSPPQYQAPIIPAQPQNEEKTLVYVLVKKPDAPQDIVIPTITPTQPSKPEVYFIKYKTQKEQGGAGGYAGNAGNFGGSSGGDFSGSSSIGDDISHSSNLGVSAGGVPSSQYGPPGK